MNSDDDVFWQATTDELKDGYIYDDAKESYICLICGEAYINGVIYPREHLWLDAKKAVRTHITDCHGSVFEFLINLNKRYTGFTAAQKELLTCFYQGLSDREIVEKQAGGSRSTVRNHRFKMREKAKQARIFLAIMELIEDRDEKKANQDRLVSIHREATMVDDRYVITQGEREKVLKNFIKDGKVNPFPSKEKNKLIILQHVFSQFEQGRRYSEKEVNEIIRKMIDDFVTVRRYLIEYGFMDRKKDCSEYWVKS